MPSYLAEYSVPFDAWRLAYRPEDDVPGTLPEVTLPEVAAGPESWTAFVSLLAVDQNSGIGLSVELESGGLLELLAHPFPPADRPGTTFVQFTSRLTLRVEHLDGVLVFGHSENTTEWTAVASYTLTEPLKAVRLVLRYDRPDYPAGGTAGALRFLDGIWQNVAEEVWLPDPPPTPASRAEPVQATVTSTSEPLVHVIVGAQFGDLEFDVGKSVRWVTWFCDNLFVLDVNLGTPRYWIVNWTETFPDAKHTVTGINYFALPAEFRAEQWKQYRLAFGDPEDDDWFLFLDAHEGLSVDNRSLPDDYDFAPFKSFLWREIQRAQDLGQRSAVLPFYVFLRSDHITNVTYQTTATGLAGVPDVIQALSVPYYESYLGQRRLWNTRELRKPDFDWSQIDTPVASTAGAKAQILSYGYAHWNLQDIEPPATTVAPLDANNDDGWRMRKLLSRVRPVPGLPVGDTWIPPEQDPPGLAGPWAPADANNPDPIDPVTGDPMPQPVPADSSLAGLVTPLYDCVFRINMRDGVWYEENTSGNIPLKWDDASQQWVTEYDPEKWPDEGVEAHDPYYVAT